MTTSSPAPAPAPTKREIQSGEGSGVACDAKKKRGKWGVPPIWIQPRGRADVGSFGLARRVGVAGVTASSGRARAAPRRAAGGCGGGATSCGWATMGRRTEESQERFPFVRRALAVIAGEGRPRERRPSSLVEIVPRPLSGTAAGYTTWVHHGEMYDSPPLAFVDVPNNTTNLATSGVPRAAAVQDVMQELLQAAFCRAEMFESVPSMSEGEVDDVESGFADMEHSVAEDEHPADDNAKGSEQNLYERYLKDAHTSLYPGCKFSKLSFLVNLYHLKCLNGWTQESFTTLLGVLADSYPPEADLPKTYYLK
ncbi:unnamed protein product [Miscanthus lutarioriparius]|uniref:Uncharacterized protein n=1 Tax=Miscanthus lutarioriparius TaxID=422564 RepID=A0A811RQN2_9POAL|nr:unnamed protein product [Miscanthus lutarioriparius]